MKEKLEFMDGIKGIACLCIAINHFINVFYSQTIAQNYDDIYRNTINNVPIVRLLYNGNFYVMIFLLVSSFIISYLLIKKKDDMVYYQKTILKRATRIILPVFVLCFIIYILDKLSAFNGIEPLMGITLSTTKDINCFKNLSIIKVFTTSLKCLFVTQTNFNFVFWMLPILYKGFFISVILSFLVRNMTIKKSISLLLISCFVVYLMVDNTLAIFAVGTLFAYIYVAAKNNRVGFLIHKRGRIIIKILAIFLLIIGLYLGSTPYNNNFSNNYELLKYIPNLTFSKAHIIGAILVIGAILCLKTIRRFLSVRPLTFLGRISFAIYLIHFPLQCSLGAGIFLGSYQLTNSYVQSLWITIPIYFIALIGVSFLFQKFVEEKLGKINNKMVDKLLENK